MDRSLSDAAKYVLEQFKRWGVEVPASSRIMDMYKSVFNVDGSPRGNIPENDPDFQTAREALRDLSQLEFYFDQIARNSNRDDYATRVKWLVSDSVHPQNYTKNSKGRDTQAEAFVFAVCTNAGMQPVFEEPDVTCEVNGERFGIAVKRIKTMKNMIKRLKEGAEQIQKRGLPGIICVEATLAVNPENRSIFTTGNEHALRSWWEAHLRATVNKIEARDASLWQSLGDKGVRGVFLHDHCPVLMGKDYLLRSMNYGIETPLDRGQIEWLEFRGRFLKGLPNLQQ